MHHLCNDFLSLYKVVKIIALWTAGLYVHDLHGIIFTFVKEYFYLSTTMKGYLYL